MKWLVLSKMLGMLGMLVGGSMLFSLPWAFPIFGQAESFETRGATGILLSVAVSIILGGIFYSIGRKETSPVLHKEALAIVGLGWLVAGVLGALPFLFSGCYRAPDQPMTIVDAVFESISGFTTTGASVLTELEDPELVPRCVLFWRSFTHWLGGMGIIVLFVAILGHLGASGKAMMRREVPGPINDAVRPRVRETAITMWAMYVSLSFILSIIFWIEGLSYFDALCHTFGTLATGGFSTFNSSAGHFDSVTVEVTITIFMIVAATNFSLFYMVLKRRHSDSTSALKRLHPLTHDPEWKTFLGILAVAILSLTIVLVYRGIYDHWLTAFRHSSFVTVSIMTSTGFGSEDFSQWGEFSKALLLMLMFIGGCAGSTAGGIKVIRVVLFLRVIRLEIERAFRPNVVRTLRIGGEPVDDSHRHDVIVYFGLVLFIFISSWMILATIEPDTQWIQSETHSPAEKLLDCASAVAATLNNIGPGLGVLGPMDNFSAFSVQGKVLLTLLMLLGRLELFAILVLFFPSFWRSQ